jgi:hypothetical protein
MATALAGARPSLSAEARLTCLQHHGYRRFWNRQQRAQHLPPLLWTFPGAGNTWIRMLLDYATGVYTGSIYGDPSLLPLLPGEGRCDRSVVAVKAHPVHLDSFDFIREPPSNMLRLNLTRKPQYAKCAPYRFSSAIVIVRDPFRAIWAEYKRYVNWREVVANRASGENQNPACRAALRQQSLHSGALLRACFDHGHFAHHAQHLARQWKHAWFHYGRFRQQFRSQQLLTISFEDLVHYERRSDVLRQMVDFVNAQPRASDDALRCAFALADSPHIHRDKSAERSSGVISIGDAYANKSLVCYMWSFVRRRASKLGYAPFGDVNCDHEAPAPKPTKKKKPQKG